MSTKMGFWRWALAGAAVVMISGTASARLINDPPSVTTNESSGIVVYPKIVTDPANGVDTVVQLTNTSEFLTRVHCLYVNANSHCSNAPSTICTQANFRSVCPLGGLCVQGWQETDFRLTLTKRQPISWSVNEGLPTLPLNDIPGQADQFNDGSIPTAPEQPFLGELRCIQVDVASELPTDRNDLKGEATIITSQGAFMDASKYNAIGIPAIEGAQDGNPNSLNLGGPEAEYRGCPNILTLNHFFDGANVVTHNHTVVGRVSSDLTLIPCAADYLTQVPQDATVQFLIFNEFEQRFSTSTKLTCYKDTPLSDIDTRPGPDGDVYSIFAVGVQGSLTGMSRLRAVAGPNTDGYNGRAVLGILEENWASGVCATSGAGSGSSTGVASTLCSSDADCGGGICTNANGGTSLVSTTTANIQYQGTREQGDGFRSPSRKTHPHRLVAKGPGGDAPGPFFFVDHPPFRRRPKSRHDGYRCRLDRILQDGAASTRFRLTPRE